MKSFYLRVLLHVIAGFVTIGESYSQNGITVAGGNGAGAGASQLMSPNGIFVNDAGTIFIADLGNHRVQRWAPGAAAGVTVAGGNGNSSGANQLNAPSDVLVDASGNIYITDRLNFRVQKWAAGASTGTTVAGGNGFGSAANQLYWPESISMDSDGALYIGDIVNPRIQKWLPGAVTGITVAGGNGSGTASNQFSGPADNFVDASRNIYVFDINNNRIQKWAPGAAAGVTVAGGNGAGTAANQFKGLRGLFVDESGNIFIADMSNNRIQKWAPGATEGVTVAGGNGRGSAANQLNDPIDVFIKNGKMYVLDRGNQRIQQFQLPDNNSGQGLAYKYYEGDWNVLPDFNTLIPVTTGSSGTPDISRRPTGRNDNFAFLWQGYIDIAVAGNYSFETVSDDGSKLYFNSLYDPSATPLISNEGIHAPVSVKGNVYIPAAGKYPITISYFEKTGGEQMQLYYSGPGIERTLIPEALFSQTAPPTSGLSYKYFEGNWNMLPDFNAIAPIKSGSSANIDPGVRTAGRNDNYAFLWQGYIKIPTAGNYTFETISDDGSKLFFNSEYNPQVKATVDNDGLHAPVSATGSVNIRTAGVYPISVAFFEKDGGEQIQVYWQGPGIARQLIPDAAFTQAPPASEGGLAYQYYEGEWDALPDFSTLTPVKKGTSPIADPNLKPDGRNDNFAFMWQGYINMPVAGTYTFETISDDGSRVYFNSMYDPSAIPTVDNDGIHAPGSATGTVEVPTAGWYPIAITFFEKDGGELLQLLLSGPGFERQPIPAEAFRLSLPPVPIAAVPLLAAGNFKDVIAENAATVNGAAMKIFPNPFRDKFRVALNNSSVANDIRVNVYDLKGRLLHSQHSGRLPKGQIIIDVNLNGIRLPATTYLAAVYVNGMPSTVSKLVKTK